MDGGPDVQAELQEYLASKNINNLFVKVVEAILLNKPENPVQFIVDFLGQQYPDQVASVSSGAPAAASLTQAMDDSDSDSDSDSDDDDDDVGDMPDLPPPPVKPRGRRQSVSAAATNDAKQAQASWQKKVIPKSEADAARIREIVSGNFLFSGLDDAQVQVLVDAFDAVEKNPGDVVISQGDDGDNYYVVDKGACDVFVKKGDDEEKKVTDLQEGAGFGELALMYNAPRAATVKATSPLKLWALDRMTFKVVLSDTTTAKRNKYKELLEKVPILESLGEYERLTVADALREETFAPGTEIIKQGEAGDSFYIIEDGEVSCTQQGNEVCKLGAGSYFGEIALLTSKPRQATVSAVAPTKCLTLDRKTFKRVMGPLQEILKRNMEQYNSFMAQKI